MNGLEKFKPKGFKPINPKHRDKSEKVYVCYLDYGHEGYSEPLAVFKNEESAWEWLRINRYMGTYVERELK